MKWTDDQLCAIKARGSSLLVSAAAGSGKTAVLVERLLRRIEEERLDITDFLVITYTKAAASELRRKIGDALYERIAKKPGAKHLKRQIALVGSARISTVHSFCTWLLRNYAENDDIAGGFRVLDESEAEMLLMDTLSEMIEEKYNSRDKGFLALADFMSDSRSDKKLSPAVLELYHKSMSHPYPEKWISEVGRSYEIGDVNNIKETPWGKESYLRAEKLVSECEEMVCLMESDTQRVVSSGDLYDEVLRELRQSIGRIKSSDWDEFRENARSFCVPKLPSSKNVADKTFTERIKALTKVIKEKTGEISEKIMLAESEVLLSEIRALSPIMKELSELSAELYERFEKEKLRLGTLDYSDLEHQTINLLIESYDEKNDTVIPTELAETISADFCEILLDEFQDSNIIQDIIFRAISRKEKNIVMVGDVKQSIYGFRLADPSIFMKKYRTFAPFAEAKGDAPRRVNLSKNFRSRREILDASNSVFSRIMTEELGGVDYNEEHMLIPRDEIPHSDREDMKCEFCLIDVDKNGEESELSAQARFTARKIREMVDSGFEVCDKNGNLRPVTYRDFAILLRSVSTSAEGYEAALEEYGIPFFAPIKGGLLQKNEVNTILSYLTVIDNPTSDIPLLATLRSPLFAFSADELCEMRIAGKGTLISAMEKLSREETETGRKCSEFLKTTAYLRARSRGMRISKLIWEVYNKTNALGLFGAMPYGEERQENLIEFYKSAEGLETLGYSNLYKFLSHISSLAERGGDIAVSSENAHNAVTIMTVHKSKGLEFPVVFVGNAFKNFNLKDLQKGVLIHPKLGVGLNFRDEEKKLECSTLMREAIKLRLLEDMKSEEMRLLYVALTRAREKLFITGAKKDAARMIQKVAASNSYEKLDKANLVSRNDAELWFMLPLFRTMTGSDIFAYGDYIINRDEALAGLCAYVEKDEREKESRVNEKQTADGVRAVREPEFLDYKYKEATRTPSKITATGILAATEKGVEIRRTRAPRPSFMLKKELSAAERGIALHMAMQFCDFSKCTTRDGAKAELLRLYEQKFLTKRQYEAVSDEKIYNFVNSDIGREMLSAKKISREFKFSLLLPAEEVFSGTELCGEDVLVQGVIDMYYETDEGITIVDFKTDRKKPSGRTLLKYSEQLYTYRRALSEITGKTAARALLYLVMTNEYIEV